jgi:ribosomal protein L16/L10AE
MLFIPKSTKFTKLQKKKIKNLPSKSLKLMHGSFGLKAKENCFLTSKQLEMVKLNLSKDTKKVGKY